MSNLWQLAGVFGLLSLLAVGGGSAVLPEMQALTVSTPPLADCRPVRGDLQPRPARPRAEHAHGRRHRLPRGGGTRRRRHHARLLPAGEPALSGGGAPVDPPGRLALAGSAPARPGAGGDRTHGRGRPRPRAGPRSTASSPPPSRWPSPCSSSAGTSTPPSSSSPAARPAGSSSAEYGDMPYQAPEPSRSRAASRPRVLANLSESRACRRGSAPPTPRRELCTLARENVVGPVNGARGRPIDRAETAARRDRIRSTSCPRDEWIARRAGRPVDRRARRGDCPE